MGAFQSNRNMIVIDAHFGFCALKSEISCLINMLCCAGRTFLIFGLGDKLIKSIHSPNRDGLKGYEMGRIDLAYYDM